MNRLALWIAALAPATLVACGGGNYCDRSAKLAEDCGETISDEDLETCREMLDNCNGDDKKLLDDSLDCSIEAGLFECDDTTETGTGTDGMDDFAAILACYMPLAGLSAECQGSMMDTDDTTTMSTMSM